jgi:hypothetical protein
LTQFKPRKSNVLPIDNSAKAAQWKTLADEIHAAGAGARPSEDVKGELLIIGSGLSRMDFTAEAEGEILAADVVFYCVYDSLTQVWLLELRPDALDLTVLYTQKIDRYHTYMQMAEAMLFYVRRGRRVLAIYYGHPGIFATPAHRAIHIAKREGHRAQMRPGISALDYLVADLGFDPAIPGMINFEATDMLLRKRRIDPSLHVVLWQVGVVGEFGFSPGGFANRGFDLLIDTLEATYGKDWPIVNYIASRFPNVAPLIEEHTIGAMRTPEARRNVQALSTFYISPQIASATDPDRSVALNLTKLGEPVQPPVRTYDNNQYGEHEIEAIRLLSDFDLTDRFAVPHTTAVTRLLIALSEDVSLRRSFIMDAEAVLQEDRFSDLSDRAKKLLCIPHPAAIETALSEAADTPLNRPGFVGGSNS